MRCAAWTLVFAAAGAGGAAAAERQGVSFQEVLALPATPANARIAYGSAPTQFGELWVPPGPGPLAKGVDGMPSVEATPAPAACSDCTCACSIMPTSALISRMDSGLPHISTQSTCQLQRSNVQPSR